MSRIAAPQLIIGSRSGRRTPRLLGAGALVLLACAAPAQAASGTCEGAGDVPTGGGQERAAAATVCVLNRGRVSRGLRPLRTQGGLEQAAEGHARDMVRRSYFSHTTPEGRTFDQRLRRLYIRGGRWGVGETLAWGTKSRATPEAIVRAWLDSPPHRRVVLNPRFRDIGLGVALGVPVAADPGATYAAELGVRS